MANANDLNLTEAKVPDILSEHFKKLEDKDQYVKKMKAFLANSQTGATGIDTIKLAAAIEACQSVYGKGQEPLSMANSIIRLLEYC